MRFSLTHPVDTPYTYTESSDDSFWKSYNEAKLIGMTSRGQKGPTGKDACLKSYNRCPMKPQEIFHTILSPDNICVNKNKILKRFQSKT